MIRHLSGVNPPFTGAEIKKTLKIFYPRKAPGIDGFTSDICQAMVLRLSIGNEGKLIERFDITYNTFVQPLEVAYNHEMLSKGGRLYFIISLGDHGLMQALDYDARNTAWFNSSISDSTSDDKGTEFIQRFGYIVAFLATHSGLTRWQTHPPREPHEDDDSLEFGRIWGRAIDEVWYRRAVDQHYVDPSSYVYSVQSVNDSCALVTAAHAVFHGDGRRKAPAAVVGFQFRHDRLAEWFENITSSCEHNKECTNLCRNDSWECFIVDNNGWIIVSGDGNYTGHFFGKVRPNIMLRLIEAEIFKAVHIVDYQAVCFRDKKTTNPASILITPLQNLRLIMSWFLATAVWLYNSISVAMAQVSGYSLDDVYDPNFENEDSFDDSYLSKPTSKVAERDFEKLVLINRTRPTPCDREMYLYQIDYNNIDEKLDKPVMNCDRPYYVQLVKYTNLLLIVADTLCPKEDVPLITVEATEVDYNESLPCLKHIHPLYRNRPVSCIKSHPDTSF
ncbi:hypothetical protein EVAR_21130_1 [Eumeta japonica]|uniref:Voltage-dependent calcium channel alpha-2/delta subunit conserved region domain-containing protein n=1 Tax=Eumeta variegata TaxID=151549 RepID=A0A4C1VSK9_EUMVA|nr:hypothetical protein EVAR_21130_1 [Eumeta japonica]